MSVGETIDLEEQYDKIYRYCYFRLHNRKVAEGVEENMKRTEELEWSL